MNRQTPREAVHEMEERLNKPLSTEMHLLFETLIEVLDERYKRDDN